MTETTPIASGDKWSDADRYEGYVGRWSRPVAREFLRWLAIPAGRRWLDVGCGTGALTGTIIETAQPAKVVGVDPSPAFVRAAAERLGGPTTSFHRGTAEKLPAEIGPFDAIVSGLVLNFVPHPAAALAEMRRVAAPGATVAAYVWDYQAGMQLMRHFWDAAVGLFRSARDVEEGTRFARFNRAGLVELFRGALDKVESADITVPTRFMSFDDYWRPFEAGVGPAPAFAASLPEPDRARLREEIREHLPIAADGTISLTARAWAVRGTA